MYELVEEKLRENNISKIQFCHDTNAYYKGGQVLRQKFKKKFITKDEAFLLLYVDDGASLFNSRNDAIVGTNIIFNQMKRMGLNMHVGSGKKASKTEAVFFPSRSKISEWLRKGKIKSIFSSEEQSVIIDPNLKEKKIPYHVTKNILDKAYNNTYETDNQCLLRIFHGRF